jgi:hypothetical protein
MRPLPLVIEYCQNTATVLDAKGQPVFIVPVDSEQQLQELIWMRNCVNDQQDILKLKNQYEAEVERLNKSLKFARDMVILKRNENSKLMETLERIQTSLTMEGIRNGLTPELNKCNEELVSLLNPSEPFASCEDCKRTPGKVVKVDLDNNGNAYCISCGKKVGIPPPGMRDY